jgi:hypothetical protein
MRKEAEMEDDTTPPPEVTCSGGIRLPGLNAPRAEEEEADSGS